MKFAKDRTKLWLTGLVVTSASAIAFAIEEKRQLGFGSELLTFAAIVLAAVGLFHYRALIRRPILIAYYVALFLACAGVFYLLSLLPPY